MYVYPYHGRNFVNEIIEALLHIFLGCFFCVCTHEGVLETELLLPIQLYHEKNAL